MKENQTPECVQSFYAQLVEENGERFMADARFALGFYGEPDDDWMRYCFISDHRFEWPNQTHEDC